MNYALITGASRGIGYELALLFAKTRYKALMKRKKVILPGMGYKIRVFLIRFIPRNLVSKLTESMVKK